MAENIGGDIYAPSTRIEPPVTRPLKVYAYDPSRGRKLGNSLDVAVRYEPLQPGPIGARFAVVDYDGAQKTYYAPVDLEDRAILMRGGLDPTEVDPRFHQQMVYAVASETLERFEAALGRKVHWRRPVDENGAKIFDKPNRLYLHPHALCQANAFYSPDAHAILFGYFKASLTDPGENLPGQTVFTCLSHDILAHETTHAIVDGVREYLMEPTNIDVAAFHEGFADLAALFRHFSHSETLIDTLQRTGGQLYTLHLRTDARSCGASPARDADDTRSPAQIQADIAQTNPLIELASQFGQASGLHAGLRSALGTPPNADDIKTKTEPHDRGSILVAAVFDAYFTIYLARVAPLFRIYKGGGGEGDDLPQPLAELLAAEVSRTAEMFFGICARSLDYCPPVDLTYGDFLRALITADLDLYPDDEDGVRDAIMQAFRLRGIVAEGAHYFSEGSLYWPKLAPETLPFKDDLVFGDPNGLTAAEQHANAKVLEEWAQNNAVRLGFADPTGVPDLEIKVPSFHPMFRLEQSGRLKIDMVVELVQTQNVPLYPTRPLPTFPVRSGVTLIIAKPSTFDGVRAHPWVRYAIAKLHSAPREERQRTLFNASGYTGEPPNSRFAINFALIHEGG
ncbi:MAG TPA: hypothetical protein VGI95_08780 [Caulobacteraceae bacterium]|jgi:hypothetical protein